MGLNAAVKQWLKNHPTFGPTFHETGMPITQAIQRDLLVRLRYTRSRVGNYRFTLDELVAAVLKHFDTMRTAAAASAKQTSSQTPPPPFFYALIVDAGSPAEKAGTQADRQASMEKSAFKKRLHIDTYGVPPPPTTAAQINRAQIESSLSEQVGRYDDFCADMEDEKPYPANAAFTDDGMITYKYIDTEGRTQVAPPERVHVVRLVNTKPLRRHFWTYLHKYLQDISFPDTVRLVFHYHANRWYDSNPQLDRSFTSERGELRFAALEADLMLLEHLQRGTSNFVDTVDSDIIPTAVDFFHRMEESGKLNVDEDSKFAVYWSENPKPEKGKKPYCDLVALYKCLRRTNRVTGRIENPTMPDAREFVLWCVLNGTDFVDKRFITPGSGPPKIWTALMSCKADPTVDLTALWTWTTLRTVKTLPSKEQRSVVSYSQDVRRCIRALRAMVNCMQSARATNYVQLEDPDNPGRPVPIMHAILFNLSYWCSHSEHLLAEEDRQVQVNFGYQKEGEAYDPPTVPTFATTFAKQTEPETKKPEADEVEVEDEWQLVHSVDENEPPPMSQPFASQTMSQPFAKQTLSQQSVTSPYVNDSESQDVTIVGHKRPFAELEPPPNAIAFATQTSQTAKRVRTIDPREWKSRFDRFLPTTSSS